MLIAQKLCLKEGRDVAIPPDSELNLNDNRHVRALLPEALQLISVHEADRKGIIEREVDLGRNIGLTDCVVTTHSDKIVFAHRLHYATGSNPRREAGKTRFVKNRTREKSTKMFIRLVPANEERSVYRVETAYIGERRAKKPWEKDLRGGEKEWWQTHALVFGTVRYDPSTLSTSAPTEYR